MNLLLNAIDATLHGGRVWLESERAVPRPSTSDNSGTAADFSGHDTGSLLRVCDTGSGLPVELGERIFEPFVSTKDTGVGLGLSICRRNVRVIVATNQKLDDLVAAGRFREDLFYRLKVYTIYLPPLRERRDDLPLLVEHFIGRFNREFGKQVRAAHPNTLRLLSEHSWPGNVRELQNALKFAMIHSTGDTLTPDCVPENLRGGGMRPADSESSLDVARLVSITVRKPELTTPSSECSKPPPKS